MPGRPTRLRGIGAVVDRRHVELDRRPAEAELVQPVVAERVRVVEREALPLDVAVAGAEGEAGIAVRQRRRLQAVRLLEAVAREEAVVRRQVVIDLHVELVVLALLDRVDQVVVDRLAVGLPGAGRVRLRVELRQDVARDAVDAVRRNDVARERLARHAGRR